MDDWSKIHEIDRQRNSESPWVTIGASLVILLLGLAILYGAWAIQGVAWTVQEEAGRFGIELSALAYLAYGIGMIFLSGAGLWLARGVRALRRGERVRTDK